MPQENVVASLLSEASVCLELRAADKASLLEEMVELLNRVGKLRDPGKFLQAIIAREETGSTGLEHGVAIPHARSASVAEAAVAIDISRQGIEFDALDGQPSRIFLMIAEPEAVDASHLEVLATASSHLVDSEFRKRLLDADSPAEVLRLFGADAEEIAVEPIPDRDLLVAAVTSCPVGVSHTYLAAERLRETARRLGIKLRVETHGSVGVKDRLTAEDISNARAVILAIDRAVDTRRFAGKRLIEVWVSGGDQRS